MRRAALSICAVWLLAAIGFVAAPGFTPSLPSIGGHRDSRSGHWPKTRAEHLLIEPACAACGTRHDLEVHHAEPFHNRPDLELVDGNLITLCRRCHRLLGHLDSWKSYDVKVRERAKLIRQWIKERP